MLLFNSHTLHLQYEGHRWQGLDFIFSALRCWIMQLYHRLLHFFPTREEKERREEKILQDVARIEPGWASNTRRCSICCLPGKFKCCFPKPSVKWPETSVKAVTLGVGSLVRIRVQRLLLMWGGDSNPSSIFTEYFRTQQLVNLSCHKCCTKFLRIQV